MCVVDENGDQVFSKQDALNGVFDGFDMADANAMIGAVTAHNRFAGDEDNDLGDAVKNSSATDGNDSSGAQPVASDSPEE